ncbi:MAG: SagB/ThcOx family dehydrogenase [Candidatus Zhuqueibacterota bacterium]
MEKSQIIHIGEYFQEFTKYNYFFSPSEMSQGLPVPSDKKPYFSSQSTVRLPGADEFIPAAADNFFTLLMKRRSRRSYSREPLTLKELAALLWGTQGVIESGYGYSYRTSPSAGARHPLETYLILNQVQDQLSGLYRYLPFEHKLVLVQEGADLPQRIAEACLGQGIFVTCAVSFIWTAIIQRSLWKYQQRAFRYIYLDAGHVCQNLYLTSEALGIGCCAVAAFDDNAVNQIIGVDGKEEFAIYLATVGKY